MKCAIWLVKYAFFRNKLENIKYYANFFWYF